MDGFIDRTQETIRRASRSNSINSISTDILPTLCEVNNPNAGFEIAAATAHSSPYLLTNSSAKPPTLPSQNNISSTDTIDNTLADSFAVASAAEPPQQLVPHSDTEGRFDAHTGVTADADTRIDTDADSTVPSESFPTVSTDSFDIVESSNPSIASAGVPSTVENSSHNPVDSTDYMPRGDSLDLELSSDDNGGVLESSAKNEIGGYEDEDEEEFEGDIDDYNSTNDNDALNIDYIPENVDSTNIFSGFLALIGSDSEFRSKDENVEDEGVIENQDGYANDPCEFSTITNRKIAANEEESIYKQLDLPEATNLLEEVWLSVFTPGINSKVILVMDICFYSLFLCLFGLLIVTGGNFHVVFLLIISFCLFASVKWFVAESKKAFQESNSSKELNGGGSTPFGQSYFQACLNRQAPILAQVISPALELNRQLHIDVDSIKREEDWEPLMKALRVNNDLKEIRLRSNLGPGMQGIPYSEESDMAVVFRSGHIMSFAGEGRTCGSDETCDDTSSIVTNKNTKLNYAMARGLPEALRRKDKITRGAGQVRMSRVAPKLIGSVKDCLIRSLKISMLEIAGIYLTPKNLDILQRGLACNETLRELSLARSNIGDDGLFS
ncbi:hypothetical protein HK100_008990 [Physocladia obscura]|uniref:Uncharacterized protein n=1 Tax=Physocladia obscura TaxID=109957 RepID=A0AAD5XI59_9FUNG|nr:hypothetical protein HK100_008990 [Physocladia obscura]